MPAVPLVDARVAHQLHTVETARRASDLKVTDLDAFPGAKDVLAPNEVTNHQSIAYHRPKSLELSALMLYGANFDAGAVWCGVCHV